MAYTATFLALALAFLLLSGAEAQLKNPSCKNNTLWDVIKQDPDLSLVAIGTQNNAADIFLNSPEVNTTVFAPTNLATIRGMYEYAGITDIDKDYFGSGLTILLLVYGVAEGQLPPQSLTSVPSVNTVMGMINNSDFTISMTKNDVGEYLLSGLAPNNTAKVLNITRACNGYVYKIDTMLQPSYLARILPTRFGFGTQIIDILYKGNCPIPLQSAIEEKIPQQSSEWMNIWNATQMTNVLNNPESTTTMFVPQNEGVAAAGGAVKTADAVMYNMLRGNWCPEELAAAGTKNSMLGEVRGKEYPLKFSNDKGTGNLLITGEYGSARVLNVTTSCNSVVYTTDVPLVPPPPPSGTDIAAPQTLPQATGRHVTCNPPLYAEIAIDAPDPSKNPAIALEEAARQAAQGGSGDVDGSSSSTSNTALAIGLGVGIGCAVLLGAGLGFVLVKRRRQKKISATSSKNNTPMSSDQSTGAKLLPGQSIVDSSAFSSILSAKKLHSGRYESATVDADGTTPIAAFASVTSIFCDSTGVATTPVPVVKADVIPSPTGRAIATTGSAGDSASNSDRQMARLVSTDKNGASVDLWEVAPADLQVAVDSSGRPIELGRGSYGIVYRGTIRQVQSAAIKVLSEALGIEATSAFWREAAILKHASRDRNIVQLYGTSTLPDGKFLLITELMELGDLRKALTSKNIKEDLAWSRKGKSVALGIARGVTALHAIKVIHRDLKSMNVLLTENFTAKVADVGIAGVHSHGYLTAGAGQVFGTLAWSAPELLMGEKCTDKVDIYSLGVVLWELATRGSVPQRGNIQPPPTSTDCPAELSALITSCTNIDPAARPSAKQIYEKLLQIPQ